MIASGLTAVLAPVHNIFAFLTDGADMVAASYHDGAWQADRGTIEFGVDTDLVDVIIYDPEGNVGPGSIVGTDGNTIKVWDVDNEVVYTQAGSLDQCSKPGYVDGKIYWWEVEDEDGGDYGDVKLMQANADLTDVTTIGTRSDVNYHPSGDPITCYFTGAAEVAIEEGGDGDGGHLRLRMSYDGTVDYKATGDVDRYLLSGHGLEAQPDNVGLCLAPAGSSPWDLNEIVNGWQSSTNPNEEAAHWNRSGSQPNMWNEATSVSHVSTSGDGTKVLVYRASSGRLVVVHSDRWDQPALETVTLDNHPTLSKKPEVVFLAE